MITSKEEMLELVEDAAQIDHELKLLKKHIEPAKGALADWYLNNKDAGKKFTTASGSAEVSFSETEVFDTIDTIALYDKLKSLGKGGDLFHVVKPDIAALRKVLGEDDIRELQGQATAVKVSVTLKWRR